MLALLGALALDLPLAPSGTVATAESLPWGATEPTWSPDGERLAFSLFGSIWSVPAQGGPARQVSSSGGFHDHPAWSPDGRSIAFISGRIPRGRFAKVRGSLAIVSVEAGSERIIELGRPTAGTPDWSSDGTTLYCPLLVDGAGALLHAIDVESGRAVPLHSRPQRGPVGAWAEVSAGRDEVVFAADRAGTPQVWSLPSNRDGFTVQMPLTRYLPEHVVQLDGVSAMAGGGAVFSADVINGRGNFEIYSVSGQGREYEALTDTPRHELAPEISPDGSRIAFASNVLGNIDLFTIPAGGGDARHVVIDELQFREPSGRVRVSVVDETGAPAAARLYVEASDGKGYAPRGEPIFYYPLDPSRGDQRDAFFVVVGDAEFDAPAGAMRLTAVRGLEYRLNTKRVEVEAGETKEVTIQLERWTNWNQRGWYSGENHFHANYLGSYYQRPVHSLAWLKAMDLNAANMIVANAQGAYIHDKEFFTGKLSEISTERHFLYWGQEYRNSDPLGHMGFLNISRLVPPSYTSVIGSDSPFDYPLNTMAAIAARDQGGLVTYMHPIGGATRDVFDTNLGAKESVVTAAFGALDTLDLLPYGDAAYQLWYTLQNCGFRIAAGAGTDAFTNWRGINRVPGRQSAVRARGRSHELAALDRPLPRGSLVRHDRPPCDVRDQWPRRGRGHPIQRGFDLPGDPPRRSLVSDPNRTGGIRPQRPGDRERERRRFRSVPSREGSGGHRLQLVRRARLRSRIPGPDDPGPRAFERGLRCGRRHAGPGAGRPGSSDPLGGPAMGVPGRARQFRVAGVPGAGQGNDRPGAESLREEAPAALTESLAVEGGHAPGGGDGPCPTERFRFAPVRTRYLSIPERKLRVPAFCESDTALILLGTLQPATAEAHQVRDGPPRGNWPAS